MERMFEWSSVAQRHMYAHHQHANERGHRANNTAEHWKIEGWELEQELLKQAVSSKVSKYIWQQAEDQSGNGSHHMQ